MNIKYIIGRRKQPSHTFKIMKEIKAALDKGLDKIFLIVPEQSTLQTEKKAVKMLKVNGTFDLQIISMDRLALSLLNEVGGAAYSFIDKHGESMIIQRSLCLKRKELDVYNKASLKPGFLNAMQHFINELKENGISKETLETIIDQIDSGKATHDKLKDVLKVYSKYQDILEEDENRRESSNIYNVLANLVPESKMLEGAHVWIDGFTAFTMPEYNVIRELMGIVDYLCITIPCDNNAKSPDRKVFSFPLSNFDYLRNIAINNGIEPIVEQIEQPIKKMETALEWLEHELFSDNPLAYEGNELNVYLSQANNRENEVEIVAQKIANKIAMEANYTYEDIAVLVPDPEAYKVPLKRVFNTYKIPYFMDERSDIGNNKCVEMLLNALRAIKTGYNNYTVLEYLKTGFSGLLRNELRDLDNYTKECGIKGKKWKAEFTFAGFDKTVPLNYLNEIRERSIQPLENFKLKLKSGKTYLEKSKAVVSFLMDLNLYQQIEDITKHFSFIGDFEKENEYTQIWNIIMTTLDQIVEVMGDTECSIDEFILVFTNGLQTYDIGILPLNTNSIKIVDLHRSKLPEIKTLFILGTNTGLIPKNANLSEYPILNEFEREALKELKIELKNTSENKKRQEMFSLYEMISTPTHDLHFSYALNTDSGEALQASYYVNILKDIFPNIELNINVPYPSITTPSATFKHLVTYLRDTAEQKIPKDMVWEGVTVWFKKNEDYKEKLSKIGNALSYKGIDLINGGKYAKQILSKEAVISTSRIEDYNKCPFKHFVDHVIKPKPIRDATLNLPDIGTIIHNLIDLFFKTIKELNIDWLDMTEEKTDELVEMLLPKIIHQSKNADIYQSTNGNKYLIVKIKRVAKRSINILVEHIQKGLFTFKDSEHHFLEEVEIEALSQNIKIKGIVDRIDVYETLGENNVSERYVKIIDYKTGKKTLSLSDVYYGISLQLLVYLDAGLKLENENNKKTIPAGTFFFHVDDPFVRVEDDDEDKIKESGKKLFQLNGLLLKDEVVYEAFDKEALANTNIAPTKARDNTVSLEEFETINEYARNKLLASSTEMFNGIISVVPLKKGTFNSCEYCKGKDICQFDESRPSNMYKIAQNSISKEDFK